MSLSIVIATLALLLFFSIIFNVGLLLQLKKKPKKPESLELREFLGDLMAGPAMLAIARIDPSDVIMRSPKQR